MSISLGYDHIEQVERQVDRDFFLPSEIKSALQCLTPREREIIILRFGFDDGRSKTLEMVGKEFAVTRERIRQIEAKALRKLRNPLHSRRLKRFL